MLRRIRNTFQRGWIERKQTRRGEVFVYRWRERNSEGGYRKRALELGPVMSLKTEARAWKEVEGKQLAINPENPKAQVVTLGAVMDRCIAEEMHQRVSTRTFYLPWFNNHSHPRWGDNLIATLKPLAVRDWLNGLSLSRKSKQHIRGLMKQLFDWAMLWELIPTKENPMKVVRLMATEEEIMEKRVLTSEEFRAILDLLSEPCRTMALIAASTGLRVSEILGLQWGDFDWEKLEIKIRRAVVLGQVGRVKTPKSRSSLPLDPSLAALLISCKQLTAPYAGPSDWAFANPTTERPWRPSRLQTNYIRPAGIKVTGESIGWHNFRHTFSTMLRSLGTDVKVQQDLLRHADIRTTLNIYTQAATAQKREAMGKVIRLVLPKTQLVAEGQTVQYRSPLASAATPIAPNAP